MYGEKLNVMIRLYLLMENYNASKLLLNTEDHRDLKQLKWF